jgi:phage replication O-like protein O
MTGYAPPNYTQTPNDFFDTHMADMGECELKVTLAIIRKTLGFHKKHDPISLSQLQTITGLSRQGVIDGVEKALERGIVEIVGTGKRGITIYGLVINFDQLDMVDQSKILTGTGQKSRHTKETTQKKKEKDSPAPKSAEPAPRNEMYDAIHAVWKYTAGRNGQLAKMLQGTSTHKDYKQYNLTTPITPDQLKQWAAWYRRTELKGSPDLNMVESPLKIQSSITYWQETVLPRRQANITPLDSSHDLNVQQPVTPMLIARRKEMQHG